MTCLSLIGIILYEALGIYCVLLHVIFVDGVIQEKKHDVPNLLEGGPCTRKRLFQSSPEIGATDVVDSSQVRTLS